VQRRDLPGTKEKKGGEWIAPSNLTHSALLGPRATNLPLFLPRPSPEEEDGLPAHARSQFSLLCGETRGVIALRRRGRWERDGGGRGGGRSLPRAAEF